MASGALAPAKLAAIDLLAYAQFGDYLAGVSVGKWQITRMPQTSRTPRLPGAQLWLNALDTYFGVMDES
jgi:hypothetical protein